MVVAEELSLRLHPSSARSPHVATPQAPSIVFAIQIVTPVVTDAEGQRHAGGLLAIGQARLPFLLECSHWTPSAYEYQWKAGIQRIAEGERSSALLTAYRGGGDAPHTLWAMWRDFDHVYVQARTVRAVAFGDPFDPSDPYPHVPPRMPVCEYTPPATQWRIELESFFASAFGLRVPLHGRGSGGPAVR